MWCFGSSAVSFLSRFFSSLSWYHHPKNLILESGRLFKRFLVICLPVLECSLWFVPCCKPSVFTLMMVSLDCRPGQDVHLLQCFLQVFFSFSFHQKKDSAIVHFSYLLWSFGPFMSLSSPVHSFFCKKWTKLLICIFPEFLLSL